MQKAQAELERLKDGIEEAQKDYHGLKGQRDTKQDERKEMWRRASRPLWLAKKPAYLL